MLAGRRGFVGQPRGFILGEACLYITDWLILWKLIGKVEKTKPTRAWALRCIRATLITTPSRSECGGVQGWNRYDGRNKVYGMRRGKT